MQPETTEALTSNEDQRSKGKRITSRVVITIVVLWFLVLNAFPLLELFLMWLPAETLADMFAEGDTSELIHRTHFMAVGVMGWALALSLVVQLRKPELRVAPMMLVVAGAIGGTIVFALSGTFGEWLLEEIALVLIPVGLVVLVHPARDQLFTKPRFDRTMGGMAALAAAPWLVYIAHNAWSQLQNAPGDPHADPEHWAIAALMGIFIGVAALLGSTDKPGWRITAWIAVGGSVIFGVHSLLFPGLASALPAPWAGAAILWGIGFGALIIRRSRDRATAMVNG